MSRVINGSWLDEYMKYTSSQESPDIFHKWCGISTVGAALERHVLTNMGAYNIRSNFFVVLVAEPAKCKKSTAMDFSYELLTRMGEPTNIFAQKITTEALISRMASTLRMEGKEVVRNSACMIFASELSVFLGSDAYHKGLVAVLVGLYDCKDRWGYETKGGGEQVLRNTWIHLLGATTPAWLKSGFPPESVGGGFTSRIVFVFSSNPRERNPFPQVDYESRARLVQDLDEIGKLRGEFKWSKDGKEWYKEWYKTMDVVEKSTVLLGYRLRKAVNLVKLAMVLSVCEGDEMVLEKKYLEQSLEWLDEVEMDMENAVIAIEKSTKGYNLEQVYSIIRADGEISRTDLIRRVSYKFSASELDELLDTLIQGSMIVEREVNSVGQGGRGVRGRKVYAVPISIG